MEMRGGVKKCVGFVWFYNGTKINRWSYVG